MEDILTKLQNEPIALVIIALLAVAIAFLFLIPAFINYIQSFNIPLIKSEKDESKEPEEHTEAEEETKAVETPNEEVSKETKTAHSAISKIKSPAPGFQKFNLKFKFTKYLVLAVIILLLLGVGKFSYDFFISPVRVVDAWQLKLEKGNQLTKLQEGGLSTWPEAGIYLLDVRSSETYAKDHVIGAESLPEYRAVAEFYPIENVTVVVYSSVFNFEGAKKVAEAIVENGNSGRITLQNPGKVFVVKDGFEGLKKSGFRTEGRE